MTENGIPPGMWSRQYEAVLEKQGNNKKMQIKAIFLRLMLAFALVAPVMFVETAAPAAAQSVQRIVVQGNQRVDRESILAYLTFSRGGRYSEAAADESLKNLFQTGLFEDVQISYRGGTVYVRVKEQPLVNRVFFRGNRKVRDKKLADEVQLRERTMFSRAKLAEDIERMRTIYRRIGFEHVAITPKVVRLSQNRVNIVYDFTEGGVVKVREIRFIGNQSIPAGTLRGVMRTKTAAFWRFLTKSDRYDPDRLAQDRELLRLYYLKKGFADVEIVSAEAQLNEKGDGYIITVTINEGPRYKVRNVSVDPGVVEIEPRRLERKILTRPGRYFDASKLSKSLEQMTVETGRSGLPFAVVRPDLQRDPAAGRLDIVYRVEEGPRVYIERIEISGNTRTLDHVIRRELQLAEGDAFNRVLLDRARRRLLALGFFERVVMREEPGSAPDKVVVVIEVKEQSTGTFTVGGGLSYSATGGIKPVATIEVQEKNLLGTGRQLKVKGKLGRDERSVDFSYTEPYLFGFNMSGGFDLLFNQKFLDTHSLLEFGGGLRLGFRLDDYQTLNLRYNLKHRTVTLVDAAVCVPGDPKYSPALCPPGTNWISSVGLTYMYDRLDHPLNPTSGYLLRASLDVAGLGGNVRYVKGEVAGLYLQPVLADHGVSLKLKGTAGYIRSWGGYAMTAADRFYKGGPTFRGFSINGVGPRDTTAQQNYVGGELYAIGTVELHFPLGLPENLGLSGFVFSDFGTVGLVTGNGAGTVNDALALRVSVGAGLLWRSPIGPLQLTAAYAVMKAPWDQTDWLQFGIATKF